MSAHRTIIVIMCLSLLLPGIVGCESHERPQGDLYFFKAGPPDNMPLRGPHFMAVYRLDETNDSVVEVTRTPLGGRLSGVKCYRELRRMIVSTSGVKHYEQVCRIYSFKPESPGMWEIVEVADSTYCRSYRLEMASEAGDIIKVYCREGGEHWETYFNTRTKERVDEASLPAGREVRLAGPRPESYGLSNDVFSLRMDLYCGLTPIYSDSCEYQLKAIPDSIIVMKESAGWNLFAAEPDYYVLSSVPHKNGLTQRELLVFNRASEQWNSLLLDGNETKVRTINGWLVGEVAQSDPATDWERRVGVRPVLSGEFALVNPVTLESYKVRAGDRAEFLWIDDNNHVYYRVGKELYRARLDDGDFVDRELILDAPFVDMIHWAFRRPGRE